LGRNSDREVVLTRTLRNKLVTLNPDLPDAAYDDAVRQVTATVASQTMAAINREKYSQMRDGVQVTFRNVQGINAHRFDRDAINIVYKSLQQDREQADITDFQQHYENIVSEYNREKDRVTIEQTFDLLKKPDLNAPEIKHIKAVAVQLLERLKKEKLQVDHWRDKESTRDAVRVVIRDYLWDEKTGLPVDAFGEDDVAARTEEVFRHIYRAYPTVPSPYFST